MSGKLKFLFLGLLVIAVCVLVYLYRYSNFGKQNSTSGQPVVNNVDVSKSLAGFPAGIPLDQKAIVEQKALDYPDKGVILYTVSYRSPLQAEELYADYQKFFSKNGFNQVSTSKNPSVLFIEVSKGGDNISVTITVNNGFNLVSIAVEHHK